MPIGNWIMLSRKGDFGTMLIFIVPKQDRQTLQFVLLQEKLNVGQLYTAVREGLSKWQNDR